MTKYYIVEFTYSGPNRNDAKHVDFNRFEITTTPPKNATGAICWEGWLGMSNNVTRFALGRYDSLTVAEYRLQNGPLLHQRFRRDPEEELPPDVLAVYRPGRFPPMSDEALDQWLECSVHIIEDYSAMGLVELAGALRWELEDDGYSVTMERMLSALESLREERED